MTSLHYAVSYNADKVVPLLLAAEADVNARDEFQRIPLHIAEDGMQQEEAQDVRARRLRVIELLRAAQASVVQSSCGCIIS